jgi:hypothetical protein
MSTPTGIIGLGDVDQLLTEINTELTVRPLMATTIAGQICWVRNGKEGPASIGKTSVFPIPFFGNRAKPRSIFEEIPGTLPEFAKFSVEHQEWAPNAELIPRYTQLVDLYGIVKDNSSTIIAQSQIEMETQLADLLGLGASTPVAYESYTKNFFATDHEANPNRPGLATFSNYKTGFDLDYTNLSTALDLLDAVPGPDGNPLSMPGKKLVITSTGAQESRARTLLNGDFIPSEAGTATQSNPLKGRADVLKLTQMRKYNSGKFWAVVLVADDKHRPFMLSQVLPPQLYITDVDVNSTTQALRGVARQGWKSVHGFGYLWPQLAVGCVES